MNIQQLVSQNLPFILLKNFYSNVIPKMSIVDALVVEIYNLVKNQVKLSKLTYTVRKVHILTITINLIVNEETLNIRSLYYQFPDLFPTQQISNSIIKYIENQLNVQKRLLNLTTSAKGLFAYKNEVQLIQDNSIIPISKITLIVEKDTIFNKLKFLSNNYLIITGKGFPDQYTLNFAAQVKHKCFGLCDFNASGHDIMRIYAEKIPNFICLGLFQSINDTNELELPNRISGVQNRLKAINQSNWAQQLENLKIQRKGELDDFIRENGEEWLVKMVQQAVNEII